MLAQFGTGGNTVDAMQQVIAGDVILELEPAEQALLHHEMLARSSWPDHPLRSLIKESRTAANHENCFNEIGIGLTLSKFCGCSLSGPPLDPLYVPL